MKKHVIKMSLVPLVGLGLMSVGMSLVSCSATNKIVFANFSGYMNPEVQDIINQTYNVQWNEYESNETIPTFLKNGTYDIAVATQYKTVELARSSYQNLIKHQSNFDAIIQPIDWSKFGLVDQNNQPLVTKDASGLYNVAKLKPYFTTQTWEMLTAYDLDGDPSFDENCKDNLLNWTIPYFAQTLSFGYRGPSIAAFNQPDVTFKTIFNYYQKLDAQAGKNITLQLIKDERTDYDLARLLDDKSIFIDNDQKVSTIDKLTQDYQVLDDAIKGLPNGMTLEGDSNNILNSLALGDISGAITYNGDLIYASNGGDYATQLENQNQLPSASNFHVVTPQDTLVCFDGLIFSNRISKNELDSAYGVAQELCFPTIGHQLINDPNTINACFPLEDNLVHPTPNLNYTPLINFDYVYYNPVWKCMYDAIQMDDSNLVDDWQKGFFANTQVLATNPTQPANNKPDGYYKNIEYPTNQVVSSNLNIANYAFVTNSVKKRS